MRGLETFEDLLKDPAPEITPQMIMAMAHTLIDYPETCVALAKVLSDEKFFKSKDERLELHRLIDHVAHHKPGVFATTPQKNI